MHKTFVTGGSGFLGKRLIARLIAGGVQVGALARNEQSARIVREVGAVPAIGDLGQAAVLATAMEGYDTVFHIAGHLSEWDPPKVFYDANVLGTRNVIEAAKAAKVASLVVAGASAVVMGRPQPMRDISEDLPLQAPAWGPYIATKAEAERLVRAANGPTLRTVIVRPPLIWGAGMPMLDGMAESVRNGQFAFPDGGRQAMSTAHVDNVVECLILAAERGRGGEAYHVTDGTDSTLRAVVTGLLATQGVVPADRSVPFGMAWRMAGLMETAWRLVGRKSKPPITRQTLRMIGQDFTISIAKARRELGYAPPVSWAEGISEMRLSGI